MSSRVWRLRTHISRAKPGRRRFAPVHALTLLAGVKASAGIFLPLGVCCDAFEAHLLLLLRHSLKLLLLGVIVLSKDTDE